MWDYWKETREGWEKKTLVEYESEEIEKKIGRV